MTDLPRHVVKYKPQGRTLRRFHKSLARVRLVLGPFGSAKTTGCLMEIYRRAMEQAPDGSGVRRTRWAVVRATYPELETTTIKSWRALFDSPADIRGRFKFGHPPTHHMGFDLADGTRVDCEVIFLALDKEDDVEKLKSLELTGIYINELSELPRAIINVGLGRIGRFPAIRDGGPTWYGIVGDTNGMPEDHWFYEVAEKNTPKGWEVFRQPGGVVRDIGLDGQPKGPWRLNPDAENLMNLPPDYYADMMAAMSDDEITVNLAASYGVLKTGKPIWPDFHETLHVGDIDPVPGIPISMGADWGLTPAAVFGQVLPDGRAIIFDEVVTEDADAGELAELINMKLDTDYKDFELSDLTGDPSGVTRSQTDKTQNVFAILGAASLPFRPAHTNDWDVRVAAISAPLKKLRGGRPQLMVARRCKFLKLGMGGRYGYRKLPSLTEEKFALHPDKNIYSHVCEAAQYWAMGVGLGRAVTRRTKTMAIVQAQTHFDPLRG